MAQWRHWNTRKYGDSKLIFPNTKEFLRKVSEIWVRALKKLSQPCPGPKNFKINQFEERQITNLPVAPASLRSALPLPLNFPSFNPLNDLWCRMQSRQFFSM